MDTDQIYLALQKIPATLLLLFYLGYLGYDYYSFETDSSSELKIKRTQVAQLKEETETAKRRIKEVEEFFKSLEVKREELRGLASKLGDMKATLSEDLDVSEFIKMVVTEAQKVGLSVRGIQPVGETKKEFYFEQAFRVNYRGVFAQVVVFLQRIRQLQRIVRIQDYNLSPASPDNGRYVLLQGNMTLLAYRYAGSKADDIAAERSATEKK